MKKILKCKRCQAPLTHAVTVVSGKDPNVTNPEFLDEKPLTPAGTCFKSYEPIEKAIVGEPTPLEFVPQYWGNNEDILECVQLTKDTKRLGGCCGLDGGNGPNLVCKCGAFVATRMTDCWTANLFIPDPKNTEWENTHDQD